MMGTPRKQKAVMLADHYDLDHDFIDKETLQKDYLDKGWVVVHIGSTTTDRLGLDVTMVALVILEFEPVVALLEL